MTAAHRWLIVALAALGLTAAAALAPIAFRRMDSFQVRHVEVRGARFLAPETALSVTGITDSSSIFGDAQAWAERLRALRIVADARVSRKLPGTVRIEVEEAVPVALVRTPELRPVDSRGRLLPIALIGEDIDLPLVNAPTKIDSDSTVDAATVRLLDGWLTLQSLSAELAVAVSEFGRAAGGGLRLLMRQPEGAVLLIPEQPDARTIRQIRLAMEHLRSEDRNDNGAGRARPSRLARMDARYADELFVSLRSRTSAR